MNTRLQVEHGVTEMVFGVDLVEWMIRLAEGSLPPLDELEASLWPKGHAIEARIYAENPARGFQPSPGLLTHVDFPAAARVRVDRWVSAGTVVSATFDPLLAKVIAWGETRDVARERVRDALSNAVLYGIETNKDFLKEFLDSAEFKSCALKTALLDNFTARANTIGVIKGGYPDDSAGLSRPRGILACRCAALGSLRRPQFSHRQCIVGQSRRCNRYRDDHRGA